MPRSTATKTSWTTLPSVKAWKTFEGIIPRRTSATDGTVPSPSGASPVIRMPTPGRRTTIAPAPRASATTSVPT